MEKIILVDVFDRQVGTAEKIEAHQSPKLHRAFSAFVYHEGRMLIQKRSARKYHSGGLWANACCSHPRIGERTEEAVLRRMEEEIGADRANTAAVTKELFSFVYMNKFHDALYEYEYDHVFAVDYGGAVTVNEEEIEAVRWVEFEELARLLCATPTTFASWFLIAAPRVLGVLGRDLAAMDGPQRA